MVCRVEGFLFIGLGEQAAGESAQVLRESLQCRFTSPHESSGATPQSRNQGCRV